MLPNIVGNGNHKKEVDSCVHEGREIIPHNRTLMLRGRPGGDGPGVVSGLLNPKAGISSCAGSGRVDGGKALRDGKGLKCNAFEMKWYRALIDMVGAGAWRPAVTGTGQT